MKTVFRFPTSQFRSIQSPVGDSKVGFFYTRADRVDKGLLDWRGVNPREVNDRSAVYRAISTTLKEEPARFHERNRGITCAAAELTYDDKRHEVLMSVEDANLHGVVDGGHTLHAIVQAQNGEQTAADNDPAYVFVKVITGVNIDQIAEIAGGLNTSQQVDLKSLENLNAHFDELKGVIKNHPYADMVAYKMNEDKPIDVREILYYLAVFDCSEYDEKTHPVKLFGRKEGIVRKFSDQSKDRARGDSFRILISKAPEILALRDEIEKRALTFNVGRYRAGKGTRIRSNPNRQTRLLFLGEDVDGKIPLGWIMPMLAGFRANVEWNQPQGSFSWIVPLEKLLASCMEQLVLGVTEIHERENSRPEYVGRNSTAWRICYNTVSQAILEWQLKQRNGRS